MYHYSDFYHFINAYKKALRNRFNLDVMLSPSMLKNLGKIYEIYEIENKSLFDNKIKSPTDVVISSIYGFNNWEDYKATAASVINKTLEDYEMIYDENEDWLLYLKSNYYASTKLEAQIEQAMDEEIVKIPFNEKCAAELLKLENKSGVYKLFNENEELVYIGKSTNLGSRIIDSIRERDASYFCAAITNNGIDATIYEAYYIGKYQPKLNSDLKDIGQPTVKLEELGFTDKTKVFE